MSPMLLVVETADLIDASRTMFDEVAEPLYDGVGRAVRAAVDCRGMAGDDPAALDWAASYERTATAAVQSAQDAVNGCYRISSLFAATADNYARAEHASTASQPRAAAENMGSLPPDTVISFPVDLSAAGGEPSGGPFGWWLVQSTVGYVWPNGHQDLLRTAAAAWHRSAAELSFRADEALLPALAPLRDSLPEAEDMVRVCTAMRQRLSEVSHAHRSLGDACDQLADHIDAAHSSVEHELISFLEWSGAIQVVGGVLSVVSFGTAEAPTQLEQAQRLGITVARISALLARFVAAVRDLAMALPGVAELSAAISAAMHDVLSMRVVSVEVAGVPGLRMLQVARDGKSVGAAADAADLAGSEARLVHAADESGALRYAVQNDQTGRWARPRTLRDHFFDHGSDFGATSEVDYANEAACFLHRGVSEGLPTKVAEDGTIRVYDPRSNTFGSYTARGEIKTFYKPSSPTYFDRQKGVLQ